MLLSWHWGGEPRDAMRSGRCHWTTLLAAACTGASPGYLVCLPAADADAHEVRCGTSQQRGRALNTPEQRGGGGVSEGGWAGEARGCGLVVRCWCWVLVLVLRELHYAALQDPGAGMEANV